MPRPRIYTDPAVLCELRSAIALNRGLAPTTEELAERMGVSAATLARYLRRLEQAGHITRDSRTARGLRLKRSRGRCPTCGQTFTAGK